MVTVRFDSHCDGCYLPRLSFPESYPSQCGEVSHSSPLLHPPYSTADLRPMRLVVRFTWHPREAVDPGGRSA